MISLHRLALSVFAFASLCVAFGGGINAQVTGNGGSSGVAGNGGGAIATPTPRVRYGVFGRMGTSPYGLQTPATTAPSPYPTFTGAAGSRAALNAYLYAQDSVGNSIDSAWPLDSNKIKNLVDLGATWVRMTTTPASFDSSRIFGAGNYAWGPTDAILGELTLRNILPVIGFEMGGIYYNDAGATYGYAGYNPQQHLRYDTPSDYANSCTAMSTHVLQVFGPGAFYSIPGNEQNDIGLTGYGALTGAPPAVVMNPSTTAGTLTIGTQYQYRVSAITSGGETNASPEAPYTMTPTTGHQSMQLNWGPVANETGGYKIYGRTAGSELLIASVAHNVLTYTDTGSITPSGALPSASTAIQTAVVEADWGAFTSACYSAIKAVDPTTTIYGGELNTSAAPYAVPFITTERTTYSCGPGTCYDGLSMHLYPSYPFPANTTACYATAGSGDYGEKCLEDLETAAGSTVPLMVSEFAYLVPATVSTETLKGSGSATALAAYAANTNTRFLMYGNVDECSLYTGYFSGGCVVDITNKKTAGWPQVEMAFVGASPSPSPSPAPIITPPSTVATLVGRWDASDTSTTVTAGKITAINDLGGGSRNLTQATGSLQPSVGYINGRQAMYWSGVSSQNIGTSSTPITTGAYSIFWAGNFPAQNPDGQNIAWVFHAGTSTTNAGLGVGFHFIATGTPETLTSSYDYVSQVSGALSTSRGVNGVYAVEDPRSQGALTMDINGTTESVTNAHTAGTIAASMELGGDSVTPGRQLIGTLGEVLIYSSVLSTTDRQKVEGYLACKWNAQASLPGGHPYKSSCP